jgi:hypothetical protein
MLLAELDFDVVFGVVVAVVVQPEANLFPCPEREVSGIYGFVVDKDRDVVHMCPFSTLAKVLALGC